MTELTAEQAKDKKVGILMISIFGTLTLFFCCGGALLVGGVAANGSESDGVQAALAATGPGCCSLGGFLMSAIGLVALKGKTTAKIAAPIVVGILSGIAGAIGLIIFFDVIWPSL